MKAVLKRPGAAAHVVDVAHPKAIKAAIGGHYMAAVLTDDATVYVNDAAAELGLDPNVVLGGELLRGPVVVLGVGECERDAGLSDELAALWADRLDAGAVVAVAS